MTMKWPASTVVSDTSEEAARFRLWSGCKGFIASRVLFLVP